MSGRELPPECARLCATLRELRAGTGLSLAALAAKTPYSKSSWERYLNGRALPPRQAVATLCALAGADPQRPLALWELAETAWSGRAGRVAPPRTASKGVPPSAPVAAPPADEPRPRLRRPFAAILGAVVLVAAAGTLTTLSRSEGPQEPVPVSASDVSTPGPGCHAESCTGKGPEDQKCSTFAQPPTTLGEQRLDGTMVKVRHSAVCETVWARVDRGTEGDRVEVIAPGTEAQQAVVKDRFDAMSSLSTPMAAVSGAALGQVRACLVRQGERNCFTATSG